MNNCSLNIIKSGDVQIFKKSGYFDNIAPSIRRCYDSKLIPFFFKYNPGEAVPDTSTKSLTLIKVELVGDEIIELGEQTINSSLLELYAIGGGKYNVYYRAETDLPYLDITKGIYMYKIEVDGDVYYSEPFSVCFADIVATLAGDFNNDFSNDFYIAGA